MALRSSSVAGLCREIELIWWRSRGDWNRTPVSFKLRVFILCFNNASTVVPTFQFFKENRQNWDAVGLATTIVSYEIKKLKLTTSPTWSPGMHEWHRDLPGRKQCRHGPSWWMNKDWFGMECERGSTIWKRMKRRSRETRKIRRNESKRTMYSLSRGYISFLYSWILVSWLVGIIRLIGTCCNANQLLLCHNHQDKPKGKIFPFSCVKIAA